MNQPEPLLRLERVEKRYDSIAGAAGLPVIRSVNLQLSPGEAIAIIGPSGSGKSTLLNMIGTLDRPTTGDIWLRGKNLGLLTDDEIAAVRAGDVGFIFQAHYLMPQCNVLENVLIPTLAAKPDSAGENAEVRARRLLDRVGLSGRLTHRPGELSGGERQRVAVVRALINQPKLLLADEPTGALDRASAAQMGRLLVELNQEEGVALIVVTHALDLARLIGKVYELRDGELRPAAAEALPGL
jgi:ABC-type lipoprotein export system ATPase subunit